MNLAQTKQYLFNNLIWGENGTPNKSRPSHLSVPLVMPDPSRVWGIDISHWNIPPVNLRRMKDEFGLSFLFIKGCDGSLRSRYSAEHVATAKDVGLPWGFYDWLYPNSRVSITAQTNAWIAQALEFEPPIGIAIDAEWTTYAGQPANPNATDLRSAHDKVRAGYRPAITYTAIGYANQYLQGFDFTREENWPASYGGTSPLWPYSYKWWQFASTLDGHRLDPDGNAELDGNYWNGTREEFIQRYGGQAPEPPPPGGTMKKYKVVWSRGVARRTAPTTSGSSTSLPAYTLNQVVDVLEDNIPDQTYPNDVNKKWVKFSDGYFGASIYGAGSIRMVDVTPVTQDYIEVYVNGVLRVSGNGTFTVS